jgi:hypothetical protein
VNWEALGAFAEIAGAIAVVASLLFVGNQLRQGQSIEPAKAQRELLPHVHAEQRRSES